MVHCVELKAIFICQHFSYSHRQRQFLGLPSRSLVSQTHALLESHQEILELIDDPEGGMEVFTQFCTAPVCKISSKFNAQVLFFCIRRERFEVSLDSEPLPRLSADGAERSPCRSRGSADARALRGQLARGSRTSREGREVLSAVLFSAAFEVFARFELTFLRPLSGYNCFFANSPIVGNDVSGNL